MRTREIGKPEGWHVRIGTVAKFNLGVFWTPRGWDYTPRFCGLDVGPFFIELNWPERERYFGGVVKR
jgi:hypothetical protein